MILVLYMGFLSVPAGLVSPNRWPFFCDWKDNVALIQLIEPSTLVESVIGLHNRLDIRNPQPLPRFGWSCGIIGVTCMDRETVLLYSDVTANPFVLLWGQRFKRVEGVIQQISKENAQLRVCDLHF